MEVGIKVWAEDFHNPPEGDGDETTPPRRHIFSAYFTFVAVDDRLRPVALPPAVPETPDEQRRFQDADRRRIGRLAAGRK